MVKSVMSAPGVVITTNTSSRREMLSRDQCSTYKRNSPSVFSGWRLFSNLFAGLYDKYAAVAHRM